MIPAEVDETPQPGELPHDYARRIAEAKKAAVAADYPEDLVLAADTVVACGRRILPKAETEDQARRCLKLLSGRRHRVYTAVALAAPGQTRKEPLKIAEAHVQFKRLTDQEITDYLAGGEWRGKAGGYAIQGFAGAWVRRLNGSYSAVVGLPLYETRNLLISAGWEGKERAAL